MAVDAPSSPKGISKYTKGIQCPATGGPYSPMGISDYSKGALWPAAGALWSLRGNSDLDPQMWFDPLILVSYVASYWWFQCVLHVCGDSVSPTIGHAALLTSAPPMTSLVWIWGGWWLGVRLVPQCRHHHIDLFEISGQCCRDHAYRFQDDRCDYRLEGGIN